MVRHKYFDPVVKLMHKIGLSLVAWRDDESARKLYSKREFKTEADGRAHEILRHRLNILFPGIPVLSEEDIKHSDIRPDRYWLIDPIDGTASWYEGFDGFVTQAAYIEDADPLYGVIHSPVTDRTWTAVKGDGARLNGENLPKLQASNRLIITDNTPKPHGIAAQLMTRMEATGYFESGSIGLKSALVADGTVDLFVKRVVVRDWDLAPAKVLLDEVGGCLALPSGDSFTFDGSMIKPEGVVVARDSALLAQAIKAIAHIESVNKI
jgi:3'(2'), 5'-bisphosphate nucleotidase